MPTATAIDNKQVMERYVAALAAGDADAVREFFAPDATWWLAGGLAISGTWIGRDAIMEDFFGTAMAHYEPGSVSLEVTGMVAEGDRVALEWTSRARTAAGEPYENFCIRRLHRARRPDRRRPRVHGHRLRAPHGLRPRPLSSSGEERRRAAG